MAFMCNLEQQPVDILEQSARVPRTNAPIRPRKDLFGTTIIGKKGRFTNLMAALHHTLTQAQHINKLGLKHPTK
jgi:hypothetical protein